MYHAKTALNSIFHIKRMSHMLHISKYLISLILCICLFQMTTKRNFLSSSVTSSAVLLPLYCTSFRLNPETQQMREKKFKALCTGPQFLFYLDIITITNINIHLCTVISFLYSFHTARSYMLLETIFFSYAYVIVQQNFRKQFVIEIRL
jgi:hypothetical protein